MDRDVRLWLKVKGFPKITEMKNINIKQNCIYISIRRERMY